MADELPTIFISHSDKHKQVCDHFKTFLISLGYYPIVAEEAPNLGRTWDLDEKVNYYLERCHGALVIFTPDDQVKGVYQPRPKVMQESERLATLFPKSTIYLKEKTVDIPLLKVPVYIPFELDKLGAAHEDLTRELAHIDFGVAPNPMAEKPADASIEKKAMTSLAGLRVEDIDSIRVRVLELMAQDKEQQRAYMEPLIYLLRNSADADVRWLAAALIEHIVEWDPNLVPIDVLIDLSKDVAWTVRSVAAYIFYLLANRSPALVPIDIVARLASPADDYYVHTSAIAALKTLARVRPVAIQVLKEFAGRPNRDYRAIAANAFLDMAAHDPALVPREVVELLAKDGEEDVAATAKETLSGLDEIGAIESFDYFSPYYLSF